jgi:hypothetical protein
MVASTSGAITMRLSKPAAINKETFRRWAQLR